MQGWHPITYADVRVERAQPVEAADVTWKPAGVPAISLAARWERRRPSHIAVAPAEMFAAMRVLALIAGGFRARQPMFVASGEGLHARCTLAGPAAGADQWRDTCREYGPVLPGEQSSELACVQRIA